MNDFNNNSYIYPKYKEDRYSEMVRTATFNPLKLTVNPLLNSGLQFGNMISIFKKELCSTVPLMVGNGYSAKEAIEAYTFNMIESYYNNAGYVPKAMSDVIFEQIYDAAKQTIYANHIGSIDDFKYKMYWTFTHQ